MARPPKYSTAEEMQKVIDKYFEDCKGETLKDHKGNVLTDKYGVPVVLGAKPPTITGLTYALGFTTRKSLLDYQDKDEFVNTITRAKLYIEAYTEERLFDRDGVNGAKFSLANNFRGWREHPEQNENGGEVIIIDDITKGN